MEQSVKALKSGKILTPLHAIDKGVILIRGRKIEAVDEQSELPIPTGAEVYDLKGLTVLPGLIDVHLHGWGGYDFSSPDEKSLYAISDLLPSFGVTTYLPTICDAGEERILEVLMAVSGFISSQNRGARAIGIHLEGPFLNASKMGSIRAEALLKPDLHRLKSYLDSGGGHVRMMTLSPELSGAPEIIQHLNGAGIVPCAGHSEADYNQTSAAIEIGVRHAAHTFNAMGPFHHRNPGIVGAVLTDDRVTAEIIPDGVHLHRAAVKLVYRCKGESGAVTVSDAHGKAGMKPGRYKDSNGREVLVAEDAVRLTDGTLAGGATSMNLLVENLAEYAEISIGEAVASATMNPARLLGIDKDTGSLEAGKDADITAVDADFNVRLTVVKGEIAFNQEN